MTESSVMWEEKPTRHQEQCAFCRSPIERGELRLIFRARSRMFSATSPVCIRCLRGKIHELATNEAY